MTWFLILLPIAAVLGLCEYKFKWKILTRPLGGKSVAALCAALFSVFLCVSSVVVYSSGFSGTKDEIKYPFEYTVSSYSPYVQQFDALMKGQTEIDWKVDEKLLTLDNVYDYAQRESVGGRRIYLWDRAMYNGKYYSYFGLAPVLTVYMPYYALTGALPSDGFVMTVFMIITAVFLPLSLWAWAWNFAPQTPCLLLVIGAPTVFFASLTLLIARGYTPFYYIASVAGCAFLSAFVFFALAAYGARRRVFRLLLWAATGISYGLIFQSRVNIALMAVFLVLPGLWFFIIGRDRSSEKGGVAAHGRGRILAVAGELCALGLPVVAFVAGSCIFNAMRFSGPFDFGSAYQLTVADTSTYKLRLTDLPYAIYHYILAQPGKNAEVYPYVTFSYSRLRDYGHYVYTDAGLGLLSVPLTYALVLSPAVICSQSQKNRRRIMLLSGIVGIFVLAWFDFCLGGVIYRYTCDMTVVAALVSCITMLSLYNSLSARSPWVRYVSYAVIVIVCAVSVITCLKLTLINDNGNVIKYTEEVAARLARWLPFGIGGAR